MAIVPVCERFMDPPEDWTVEIYTIKKFIERVGNIEPK